MTIVECEKCETKFISEKFGSLNACDTCNCGNLQLIVIPSEPPTKLRSFLTVRYHDTYPKIYEILEEKEKTSIEETPTKKLGFN
jgi:hypothetical protein